MRGLHADNIYVKNIKEGDVKVGGFGISSMGKLKDHAPRYFSAGDFFSKFLSDLKFIHFIGKYFTKKLVKKWIDIPGERLEEKDVYSLGIM